ncbi:PREDICTED: protein S100-P-like [Nanorana parkeri]|uniref:protein S100-P-like n=1 Tax=Nanorana parkeri TaxID=125878 RepID=UPI0008547FDB|nr:PREDICTED: protein S100-P-like [Nanorana parkeri]
MTELETVMVLIMDVFDKYAGTEGKKETLTKTELKNLMENELPGILKGAKGKDDCDKLLKDLDENGDSEIDFKEFVIFVASFTCLVHERFQESAKK